MVRIGPPGARMSFHIGRMVFSPACFSELKHFAVSPCMPIPARLHRSRFGFTIRCEVESRTLGEAMKRALSARAILVAVAFLAMAPSALATDYPARNVTFVVPTGPGAGTDLLARILAT